MNILEPYVIVTSITLLDGQTLDTKDSVVTLTQFTVNCYDKEGEGRIVPLTNVSYMNVYKIVEPSDNPIFGM